MDVADLSPIAIFLHGEFARSYVVVMSGIILRELTVKLVSLQVGAAAHPI